MWNVEKPNAWRERFRPGEHAGRKSMLFPERHRAVETNKQP
jgi:hypothetical protein